MLRFADDIAIISKNEEDSRKILETTEETMGKELNMKVNAMKTKILVCSRKNNIRTRIKQI